MENLKKYFIKIYKKNTNYKFYRRLILIKEFKKKIISIFIIHLKEIIILNLIS
jgi:hypothetical protein